MARPFAPPKIYHDTHNIYLDWGEYAQKFPYTEGGLTKALKTIPNIASEPGYVTGRSNVADKLLDTRSAKIAYKGKRKKDLQTVTEGQRMSASSAIRRMKPKGEQQS